jgi:hypothetical protein
VAEKHFHVDYRLSSLIWDTDNVFYGKPQRSIPLHALKLAGATYCLEGAKAVSKGFFDLLQSFSTPTGRFFSGMPFLRLLALLQSQQ